MKFVSRSILALVLIFGWLANSAMAGGKDPLFINLTSDDSNRTIMAVSFGGNQLRLGHPLTIFLNDKAVFIASKTNGIKFARQQKSLTTLLSSGATILICPTCMKHYGIAKTDLLPGVKVGNPELTGDALFKDGTRTLSW